MIEAKGPTLTSSAHSRAVEALAAEWEALRSHGTLHDDVFARTAVEALAKRVAAQRSTLHLDNARIQAEFPDDDVRALAEIESNQESIKRCTTLLNEINEAFGRTSQRVHRE